MNDPEPINLIRVFDFYLAMMFLISLLRRWEVYWDAVRILVAVGGRWPRLVRRMAEHHSLLLNWSFIRPAALALGLTLIQMICSRMIWPHANLTGPQLRAEWWWFVPVLVTLGPMLWVDGYFVLRVGTFDRAETVKYLDMAETWLGWRGRAVRVVTLGFVDPTKMVDVELKKSLQDAHALARWSLNWVSAQTGCRVLFGLTLWTIWALHR